jgi:hypothetical protein
LFSLGAGWLTTVAAEFGAGRPTLFTIIAASSVVGALICVAATLSGAIWRATAK